MCFRRQTPLSLRATPNPSPNADPVACAHLRPAGPTGGRFGLLGRPGPRACPDTTRIPFLLRLAFFPLRGFDGKGPRASNYTVRGPQLLDCFSTRKREINQQNDPLFLTTAGSGTIPSCMVPHPLLSPPVPSFPP